MIVYESARFRIVAPERPHISRTDGGHLLIAPIAEVEDRTKLSASEACELMKLTMVTGEAMKRVLAERGIDIGRINYQDNGNWTPYLHIHLYGRAKNAVGQPYGTPVVFPRTREEFAMMEPLEPLTREDVDALRAAIEALLETEKYQAFN